MCDRKQSSHHRPAREKPFRAPQGNMHSRLKQQRLARPFLQHGHVLDIETLPRIIAGPASDPLFLYSHKPELVPFSSTRPHALEQLQKNSHWCRPASVLTYGVLRSRRPLRQRLSWAMEHVSDGAAMPSPSLWYLHILNCIRTVYLWLSLQRREKGVLEKTREKLKVAESSQELTDRTKRFNVPPMLALQARQMSEEWRCACCKLGASAQGRKECRPKRSIRSCSF